MVKLARFGRKSSETPPLALGIGWHWSMTVVLRRLQIGAFHFESDSKEGEGQWSLLRLAKIPRLRDQPLVRSKFREYMHILETLE